MYVNVDIPVADGVHQALQIVNYVGACRIVGWIRRNHIVVSYRRIPDPRSINVSTEFVKPSEKGRYGSVFTGRGTMKIRLSNPLTLVYAEAEITFGHPSIKIDC